MRIAIKDNDYSYMPVWKDYPKSGDTPFQTLYNYLRSEKRVYDCDGGGTYIYLAGVKDDDGYHWFEVEHEFYWDSYTDEDCIENYVENSFNIKALTEQPEGFPKDRNWFIPASRAHPDPNNWPPLTLDGFKLKAYIDKIK